MGKITAQEEADLWAGIRKQVKKGSDAWYEATEKMKEAKTQAQEDLKAANAKILSDAQTYVADKKASDEMSVKDEIQVIIILSMFIFTKTMLKSFYPLSHIMRTV